MNTNVCTEYDDCLKEFQAINWIEIAGLPATDPKNQEYLTKLENIQERFPEQMDKFPLFRLHINKLKRKMPKSQFQHIPSVHQPLQAEQTTLVKKDDVTLKDVFKQPKECGMNIYSSKCEENISIGKELCEYKDSKCQPLPNVNIAQERHILMDSIISDIEQVTDKDLLSLTLSNLPEKKVDYEMYINNNDDIELKFKIAIISELVIRLQTSRIDSSEFKFNLKYIEKLEKQLNNKLKEPSKFKLEPFDEKIVFRTKPTTISSGISIRKPLSFDTFMPASSAVPGESMKLLHDNNRVMSCYINSTLFALFHKKNNPFIQMLEKSPVNENLVLVNTQDQKCNNNNIKQYLIEYYQKIHGETSKPFPTDTIRSFLQDCVYYDAVRRTKYNTGFWTRQQQDNNDFLDKIINIFNFKKTNDGFQKIEQIVYTEPLLPFQPDVFPREKLLDEEFPIYVMMTDTDKLNIQDINDEEKNINGIIIYGNIEDLTEDNYASIERGDNSFLVYKKRQMNNIYNKPNMLIISTNRTSGIRSGDAQFSSFVKSEIPIVIPFTIGNFYLYSIVVHHGSKSLDGGHYTCYFRNRDRWYLMDDTNPTIVEIDITNPHILDDISKKCTTLVYYPM
jgi:hypothetical protein